MNHSTDITTAALLDALADWVEHDLLMTHNAANALRERYAQRLAERDAEQHEHARRPARHGTDAPPPPV
ncbi:hypothetical protein [Lysobacter niastensis]|uniref:DUF4440 domain-containing protein n=1 Tax=Lysobacter niastensis TaxID=380629 RepID=A0ABS0B4L4_9GAMM|nr:hypothetical protein [Lysobacter niastensis]MBF6022803.1 hypothetical protein [Lysobacter niastensis]